MACELVVAPGVRNNFAFFESYHAEAHQSTPPPYLLRVINAVVCHDFVGLDFEALRIRDVGAICVAFDGIFY